MRERRRVTDVDYERLLAFRTGLRAFLKWSSGRAAEADLSPVQHQLLLAIRGDRSHERGPTIGGVARHLLIKPHTAAELVARAVEGRLVERVSDPGDARIVRLRLSRQGEDKLEEITEATLEELERLAPTLNRLWEGLETLPRRGPSSATTSSPRNRG